MLEPAFATTDPMRFNDAQHLNNFLNYLYRTDRAQKWTCEATPDNREFCEDCTIEYFPDDFSARYDMKHEAHQRLMQAVGATRVFDIRVDPFESFVAYLLGGADPLDIANILFAASDTQERWTVDLIVLHVDQDGGDHLHVVGHLNDGIRRKEGESLLSLIPHL